MKLFGYPFFLFLVLLLNSCVDDNIVPQVLRYDGANLSAPQMLPGDYQMAARFPASALQAYQGKLLEEVQVYIQDRPARAEIIVYGGGSETAPGPILYSAVVTADLRRDQWNSHLLDTPVAIDNQDLWIAIMVRHQDPMGTVGCDPGPAVENGDLLMDANGTWTDLRAFSNNSVNINWNIRGILSE